MALPESTFTGAMVALVVPDPENYAVNPPVEGSLAANDLHITLAFLGEASEILPEQREAILDAVQVLADTSQAPESLFPATVGVFPPDPESSEEGGAVPHYAAPANPERFSDLRNDLMVHLGARGVGDLVSIKHPVFTPHVTLAYAPLDTPPNLDHLPTPMPTMFHTLVVKFGDEAHEFELGQPAKGPELPLTASVRSSLGTLSTRVQVSEDYLTALYLRQRQVRSTPAQTRSQAALNIVASLVDEDFRAETHSRIRELHDRIPLESSPAAKALLASRALALAGRTQTTTAMEARELSALTASLRSLVADGNSSAARSLRARQQLRDRYGRWIEMGGGVRFKVRVPGAPGGGTWYHGVVTGFDMPNKRVLVKLEDGRNVKIPNDKLEQPKAIIGLKTKATEAAKKFVPKSAGRKGKATLPTDIDPEATAQQDALDKTAIDALDSIRNDVLDLASKEPTGGHIVRLALDATNDPSYAENESPEFNFTGKIAPFKDVAVTLSSDDLFDVRAAYDARVQNALPGDFDSLSDEDRKKALSKAQSGAIGALSGLYNDKNDDDAVELRKMPSVGTDSDLEEVDVPEGVDPQGTTLDKEEHELTGEKLSAAVTETIDELNAAVPSDSSLAGMRDRLTNALANATADYLDHNDLETFHSVLDHIKETADSQEPGYVAPGGDTSPEQKAFSAFAEDVDNIHAAINGKDNIEDALEAVQGIYDLFDSAGIDEDEGLDAEMTDVMELATRVMTQIGSGDYVDSPVDFVEDLQQLRGLAQDTVLGEDPNLGEELRKLDSAIGTLKPSETPDAPETTEEPTDIPSTDPEDYTDSPDGASDPEKAAWKAYSDIFGSVYELFEGGDSNYDEYPQLETDEAVQAYNDLDVAMGDWYQTAVADIAPTAEMLEISKNVLVAADNLQNSLHNEPNATPEMIKNLQDAKDAFQAATEEAYFVSDPAPAPVEDATEDVTDGDIPMSKFTDVSGELQEFVENYKRSAGGGSVDFDVLAADANAITNIGKDYVSGKSDAETVAKDLASVLDDLNIAHTDLDEDYSESVEDFDNILGNLADLRFDITTKIPVKDAPEAPEEDVDADTALAVPLFSDLTPGQEVAYEAAKEEVEAFLESLQSIVNPQEEEDLENISSELIDEITHLTTNITGGLQDFEQGELDVDEFKHLVETAFTQWTDSSAFKVETRDYPPFEDMYSGNSEQFQLLFAVGEASSTPASEEAAPLAGDYDADLALLKAKLDAAEWADPDVYLPPEATEELADWEKELLGISNNTAEDDVKDVAARGNAISADLENLSNSDSADEETQAAASVKAELVDDLITDALDPLIEKLEASMNGSELVSLNHLEDLSDALAEDGSPLAKTLGKFLDMQMAAEMDITHDDLAGIYEFLNWTGQSDENSEDDKADLTNVFEILEIPPADVVMDEADEAPAAPAAESHNAEGALDQTDALAEWKTQLEDYLAQVGSAEVDTPVEGSNWNGLTATQKDNFQDIIDNSGLPVPVKNKLQYALDAHNTVEITDDTLIQAISSAIFDIPSSKTRDRLRGVQSGIQVNKGSLVPILRPKPEAYKKDTYTDEDLSLASPGMVIGTINAIVQQASAGADLAGLDDTEGSDDEKVKNLIASAQNMLEDAVVAFNAGDVDDMVARLRIALDQYDEAIALRKDVHKQDKIVRRLRARRRSLDELLAPFEGRWPDPVNPGNAQNKTGGYTIDNSVSLADREGNDVYPGDIIERFYKNVKGQTALVIANKNANNLPRALVQLDDHPELYHKGLGNKGFTLLAVGPNNPLFNDDSYTGPRVGEGTYGTFGDLPSIQDLYIENQKKKGIDPTATGPESDVPASPETPVIPDGVKPVSPEVTETPEAPGSPAAAFNVLPEDERGESGDGYYFLPSGTGKLWGKFGASGMAFVAVDPADGKKKVLIGQKGTTKKWYLPGGAKEELETPQQAVAREFSEEVTTSKNPFEGLTSVSEHVWTEPEGGEWKYHTFVGETEFFEAAPPEGAKPWELVQMKWVDSEELAQMDGNGELLDAIADGKLAEKLGLDDDAPEPSGTDDDVTVEDLADPALQDAPETDAATPAALSDVTNESYDMSSWTKVGGNQGGSNQGMLMEDEDGQRWYVKSLATENHAHAEVLASLFYEKMGINAAHVRIGKNGNKTYAVSKWAEGATNDADIQYKNNPEWLKEAYDGFAVDAWLSNYDVVGGAWDNLMTDADGKPFRMDNGSSFFYKAQGGTKMWWGDTVTDLEDMRSPSWQNKTLSWAYGPTATLFGGMTSEDVKNSAKKLLDISPEDIKALVDSTGLSPELKESLAQTMTNRRHNILEKTGLLLPIQEEGTPENKSAAVDKAIDAHNEAKKEILAEDPATVANEGGWNTLSSDGVTEVTTGMTVKDVNGNVGVVVGPTPGGKWMRVKFIEDGKVRPRKPAKLTIVPDGADSTPAVEEPEVTETNPVVLSIGGVDLHVGEQAKLIMLDGSYTEVTLGAEGPLQSGGNTIVQYIDAEDGTYWADSSGFLPLDADTTPAPEAPATATSLGEGYVDMPAGSVPLFKHATFSMVIVQHPDGSLHTYNDQGNTDPAFVQNPASYSSKIHWKTWTPTETTAPVAEAEVPMAKLPGNFASVPAGSTVEWYHPGNEDTNETYAVRNTDGSWTYYYADGTTEAGNLKEQYLLQTFEDPEDSWTKIGEYGDAPAASETPEIPAGSILPSDYTQPPAGSTAHYFKDLQDVYGYNVFMVEHPDGTWSSYYSDGDVLELNGAPEEDLTEQDPDWKIVGDDGDAPSDKLPVGYAAPPAGAEVTYYQEDPDVHYPGQGVYGVKLPTGEWATYSPGGHSAFVPGNAEQQAEYFDGWGPAPSTGTSSPAPEAGTPAASTDPNSTGLMTALGEMISVGDIVSNKGGTKMGKVVGVQGGKIKFELHDENGKTVETPSGKPKIGTYSPEGLWIASKGSTPTAEPVGEPGEPAKAGAPQMIYTDPDTTNPIYGTEKPVAPSYETTKVDMVDDAWLAKANEEYQARQKAKYPDKATKTIQQSSLWQRYELIKSSGSENDLNWLVQGGYMSEATKAEALTQIAAQKQIKAAAIAEFEKQLDEHAKKLTEWQAAHGQPILKLSGPDFGWKASRKEAVTWMNKNMKADSLTTAEKDAANNQKGSGHWKQTLYNQNKNIGLDDESIKEALDSAPGASSQYLWSTYKGIKEGAKKTPMKRAMWAIRTIPSNAFHKKDGTKFSAKDPQLQGIIGSIQKDPASAEMTPGHSEHGGSAGMDIGGGDVLMDILIPEGMPVIWTGTGGFSHAGEHGILPGGAVGYYIHNVEPGNFTNGAGKSYKWRVTAEMIPAEYVGELDNLKGTQYEPSVIKPGDPIPTNSVDPEYKPNGLIEGGIIPTTMYPNLDGGNNG